MWRGPPRACAAHSPIRLDLPMSTEPPTTAAAVAEPLDSDVSDRSRLAFLKMPACWPYRIGVMSSSPAAARRSGTGPAAHVRDGSSGNAKPDAIPASARPLESTDHVRRVERLGQRLEVDGGVDDALHRLGVEPLAVHGAPHARDDGCIGARVLVEDLRRLGTVPVRPLRGLEHRVRELLRGRRVLLDPVVAREPAVDHET